MKRLKKLFFTLILMIISVGVIFAGVGTDNMAFMKFSPSVRANALADTTVSLPLDVNNMFYNPAGAWSPSFFDAGFSYTTWVQSISFLNFAGKIKLPAIGNVGFGLVSALYEDMNRVKEENGVLVVSSEKFQLSDYYFLLNYNKNFGKKLFIGANIKLANEKIDVQSATGFGGDFGAIYLVSDEISTGLSILNLGIGNMPMIIKAGANYNKDISEDAGMILSCEVDKNGDSKIEGGAGLELKLMQMFFFRTGYRLSKAEGNFRIGAGMRYKSFQIDYSFNSFSELGNIHRIGLKYILGK